MYSTPPPSLSPNPYNLGAFLRPKTPPTPTPSRRFDLGINSRSSGRGATGTRPLPRRTSSDNVFHNSAGVDVNMTPGENHTIETRGSRGSPSRESGRCSTASSRSASPQKRPWYPASSPASSRSASPHKRPWYPAGRRRSSGESGRSGRGGHEDTYVVHPTFRHHHLFNEGADGSDAGGTRGQDYGGASVGVDGRGMRQHGEAVPGAGMDDSSCSLPQTAAKVLQLSESDRKARSATGQRRETTAIAYRSTKKNDIPNKLQRQDKGRPAGSGRTHIDGQIPLKKERSGGRRTDQRANGQHLVCRESVDMVRGRVRDLQSREQYRSRKSGLSAGDHTKAGPTCLSSALFVGHSEQVLALAQHQDVMFSAAADGTAKVNALFSLGDVSRVGWYCLWLLMFCLTLCSMSVAIAIGLA